MNPTELAACLIKGEDLHTEFEGGIISADDLAASTIAFANTDGGRTVLNPALCEPPGAWYHPKPMQPQHL